MSVAIIKNEYIKNVLSVTNENTLYMLTTIWVLDISKFWTKNSKLLCRTSSFETLKNSR